MVTRYKLRLYFLTLILIAGFGALVSRLWTIQVKRHNEFLALIPGSTIVTQRVPGVRGQIMDRNGIILATNRATFEVSLDLAAIEKEYRRRHLKVPTFEYEIYPSGVRKKKVEPDIVAMVKSAVIEPLNQMGLAKEFNATQLRVHYRSKKDVVPFRYRQDLRFEEFATFAEYNLGLPGVTVSVRPVREYPFGSLACHILGYVREADDTVPDGEKDKYDYYIGDDYGISGLEKALDAELRGKPGQRSLQKNEKGVLGGEIRDTFVKPQPGADVYLTIDARKQYLVEKILRDAGVGRCGAAVLDPRNGEILAMASVPSFDPNSFIPRIKGHEWKQYLDNKAKPFLNRAIAASPPGSTFKAVAGIAGFLNGQDKKAYYCDGGQTYGRKWMKCWISARPGGGSHGRLSLADAVKVSCNDFFYQYGNDAGIRRFEEVGTWLGLGSPTGIILDGEESGRLPTPEWIRMHRNANWSSALTALVSIGQGDMEATPLQMASVTATIANRGKGFYPRLISRTVYSNGDESRRTSKPRIDLVKEGIKPEQIEKIRLGMKKVVNEGGGTARRAYSARYLTAGKTGSATVPPLMVDGEPREDTHAWFIAFAPYDEPEVAVCVRVEGGSAGGKVAAPIAAKVIEGCFAVDEGVRVKVRPMPEAEGHFEFLEEVILGGDGDAFVVEDVDEAVTVDEPATTGSPTPPEPENPAAPRIQPEVDEGGRVEQSPDAERNTEYKKADPQRNP